LTAKALATVEGDGGSLGEGGMPVVPVGRFFVNHKQTNHQREGSGKHHEEPEPVEVRRRDVDGLHQLN
jgi:hypothetical protein